MSSQQKIVISPLKITKYLGNRFQDKVRGAGSSGSQSLKSPTRLPIALWYIWISLLSNQNTPKYSRFCYI